jgi:hypothetical protein
MIDRTDTDETDSKTLVLSPPRWMTKGEKNDFRRILAARNALSIPVLASEVDILADYVNCRSRVAALRKLTKLAIDECLERDSYGRQSCIPRDQRHAASMIRQLDASSALARRLARALGLFGTPAAKEMIDD